MRSSFLRFFKKKKENKEVAIPSKWGLLSYAKGGKMYYNGKVAIPSKWGLLSYILRQKHSTVTRSQSLLIEVFFPTLIVRTSINFAVAIPSNWGLISYISSAKLQFGDSIVAIPSNWGLISYNASEPYRDPYEESQSLLIEVLFPTLPLMIQASRWAQCRNPF